MAWGGWKEELDTVIYPMRFNLQQFLDGVLVLILPTCEQCSSRYSGMTVADVIRADGVYVCPQCGKQTVLNRLEMRFIQDPFRYIPWEVGPDGIVREGMAGR
jgi:predicted RNA-binding Zn-ribbon protein involved in translation (DUF1610 family)